MKSFSLSLGKIFGIKTSIHWTFWILILWIIFSNVRQGQGQAEIIWYLLFVFTIFGCVVLHELGHALAARRYGIETRSITILPIGGVASLEKIPEDPKQELVVALAGPLVNVVIATLLYFFLSATGKWILDSEALTAIHSDNFLLGLFTVNVLLVLFNLIPAFPMDGGRVLRALLGFRMDRVKATEVAVTVGKFFAILFVFWGFSNNPFLIFIALFIFLAAQSELAHVRSQSLLKGFTVRDALMTHYHVLQIDQPLADAVQLLLRVQDQHFLVMEEGRLLGILSKADIINGLAQYGQNIPIRQITRKEFLWLDPGMPIQEAQELLVKNGLTASPVREGDALIGMFDIDNMNEFLLIRNAEKERTSRFGESAFS